MRKETPLRECNRRGVVTNEEEAIQRFWSRVQRGDPDACWPWQCPTSERGYALIEYANLPGWQTSRTHLAVAFYAAHGRWPGRATVTCGNTLCCNAAHIIDATEQAMNPKRGKGKWRNPGTAGDRSGTAVMTEDQVRHARRLRANTSYSIKEIAAIVEAPYHALQKALSGISWTHLK